MRSKTRVLVALTASPYDPADLERAAELASALEADLHGLFLEDLELLALAALPGATEISLPRAIERKLEVDRLEEVYRLEAEKARARLLECGAKVHVRCGFEVIRERRLPGAMGRARESDVVFVLSARRGVAAPRRRGAGPVVVICDESPAGRRALRAGDSMARRLGARALAVLADGMARAQRATAVESLRTEAPGATFVPSQAHDWQDWAALARGSGASLILIGMDPSKPSPTDVERLARLAGCPAVFVR